MSDFGSGWKILTHDGRPPIQGGESLLTGPLPLTLPAVPLDTGPADCGSGGGWHYCANLAAAARIAGLWPDGRPSRAFCVEASEDAIERGDKRRASSLTLLREATAEEWEDAVGELSRPFGVHAERMAAEQLAWRAALARTGDDAETVESGLRVALAARGLDWSLRRVPTARDAWDAWDVRAAWDARAARAARAAWAARASWDAWDAWDAPASWDVRAARDAWDAWAARAALTVCYAGLMGWVSSMPDLLTAGLRDAYAAGLAIAVPTGPSELGWAMEEGR